MNLTVAKGIETNLHILTAEKKLAGMVEKADEGEEAVITSGPQAGQEQEELGEEFEEQEEIDPKEQAKQDKEQDQEMLAAEIFRLGPEGVDELLGKFRMPPATNITESIADLIGSQSPELLRAAMDTEEGEQIDLEEETMDTLGEITI